MFGIFKKRPLEEKYGRDIYLSNSEEFKANDDNWILMLSSIFVEASDMDALTNKSIHDHLIMYDKDELEDDELDLLKYNLDLKSPKKLKKRMKHLSTIKPLPIEDDIYHAINCNSLDEAKQKAHEENEDDDDFIEVYQWLWKDREKYQHMHFRVGYIAYNMWQIRLAALFDIIDKETAWEHLHILARFIRPMMTLFNTWEEYNENILFFHNYHEFSTTGELPSTEKYYIRAIAALNARENSPLKRVPIDLGVDKNYPYNITKHSYRYVKRVDSCRDDETEIMFSNLLEKEDKSKLWKMLDDMSEKDRNFYVTQLPYLYHFELTEEDYLEIPELYPDVSYAYYLRGEYFHKLAWKARGNGVSGTVGEDNYDLFYERLSDAVNDFLKAHELSPNMYTYWSKIYDLLGHFNNEESSQMRKKFYELITENAINHDYSVRIISRWKEKRWGGSHRKNLDWAREVIAKTNRGDSIRYIIFNILIEKYDYIKAFDEDEKKANAVFEDKALQTEVNQYFDELIENIDNAPYSIGSALLFWYIKTNDWDRVRKVIHSTKEGHFDLNWLNDEYYEEYTELYINWVRSV